MNRIRPITFALLAATALTAGACSDKTTIVEPPAIVEQPTTMMRDLPADTGSTGHYTFFRLKDSTIVPLADSNSTKWDLAFNSTSILTNGGANGPGEGGSILLTGMEFDTLGSAPESGYTAGAVAKDWYTYTGSTGTPPHTILMKPGVVLVIKTAEGKYAKLQIQSYYKGAPANLTGAEPSRYYTFRYFYQPNGSRTLKN